MSYKKKVGKGNIPTHYVACLFSGSCIFTRSGGTIGPVWRLLKFNSHFQAVGEVRIREKKSVWHVPAMASAPRLPECPHECGVLRELASSVLTRSGDI